MAGPAEPLAQERPLRVLSLCASTEERARVHNICSQMASGCQCVDTATATDAVLALLTGPVDLVIVDTDAAGELLPGLLRHLRRSAPRAGLLGFHMGTQAPLAEGLAPSAVHPWSALPAVLGDWVAGWQWQPRRDA